ncbi:Type 2A phosphatase-associated protein 42 [Savitreella phatthalungensis]
MSLKDTLSQAEARRAKFEETYDQTVLKDTIAKYDEAQSLASKLSLFSSNETLDDLSTADLPYVLLKYHLGCLLFQVADPAQRSETLAKAEKSFSAFLGLVDDYSLAHIEDASTVRKYLKRTASADDQAKLDASDQRQARIERFRREKALEESIAALQKKSKVGGNNDDEENLRTLHLQSIRLAVSKALQEVEAISREQEILRMRPVDFQPRNSHGPSRAEREAQAEQATWRVDASRGKESLIDQSGRPLQPFVIAPSGSGSTRDRMRREVFRPDHSLPTMTIDEYLELERQRGGIISQADSTSRARSTAADSLGGTAREDAREETERRKAIDWDNFTEHNPKGAGNTMMNRG